MTQKVVFAGLLLAAISSQVRGATLTVNVADDPAGAGTCPAACSLRQAIATAASGDTVLFDAGLASPITLGQGALVIDKALTVQGPGAAKLAISANNASQVFVVSAQAVVSGLSIVDGSIIGAAGDNGADNTGATGGLGGDASGACVQVAASGTLVLDHIAVRHCVAYGGSGGNGGSGTPAVFMPPNPPAPGGSGGTGGAAGQALGAAILVSGSLSLLNSSVVDGQAYGGAGGAGGVGGGPPFFPPVNGIPGPGGAASGGAIFVATGASLRVTNSTITASSATGGSGGNAAGGVPSAFPVPGGPGGNAQGGLIRVESGTLTDLEFSTLTGGRVTAGSGGSGTPTGIAGNTLGNAISAAVSVTALSSVIVDVQSGVSLCDGAVTAAAGSVNLGEDTSCSGFTLQGTFAQLFHPLDLGTTPWPGYAPLYQSAIVDAAATCQDLAATTVGSDQHDTPRPQGAKCDLGAIESDELFANGFE